MGKLVLFCVAVSVLCSLLTADAIPVDPNFNPKKLTGKWYPLLTYSSPETPPNYFTLQMKPLSDGGFSAVFEKPVNGTCQELMYNFKRIKPGSYQSEDGKIRFDVLMTDYTKILYAVYETKTEFMFQAMGKKTEVTPTWKQKFQNFAKTFGFKSGEVKDISHGALCTSPPKRK